jgi:hypothetical protein
MISALGAQHEDIQAGSRQAVSMQFRLTSLKINGCVAPHLLTTIGIQSL